MQRPTIIDAAAAVNTDELRVDPFNTNTMEPAKYEALKRAIDELGFLQPILVLRRKHRGKPDELHIIDGHHRVKAAKELGLAAVPALIVDSTEHARRILNIGMNRNRGEPMLSAVAVELQKLVDGGVGASDLQLAGFTDDELHTLLDTDDDSSILDELGSAPEDKPADDAVRFVLEVEFTDRKEYQRAKRALRKIAGKDGELSSALLALLD